MRSRILILLLLLAEKSVSGFVGRFVSVSPQTLRGPLVLQEQKRGKINGDATASMSPFYNQSSRLSTIKKDGIATNQTVVVDETKFPPIMQTNRVISNETVTGIGGATGISYDVNRLKRNLLQETMQIYKQDLLQSLDAAVYAESLVVDKLAALVQASPVRTTTDSNLLDGPWCLAFQSKLGVVADLHDKQRSRSILLNPAAAANAVQNFQLSSTRNKKKVQVSPAQRPRRVGLDRITATSFRTCRLEELGPEEDAHVVDEVRWFGGFLKQVRRSHVTGLTRTSMRIKAEPAVWSFLGTPSRKGRRANPERDVQVVYCDVDLCILAEALVGADVDSRRFAVYTKNSAWMDPVQRGRRKFRWLLSMLQAYVGRLAPWPSRKKRSKRVKPLVVDPILREIDFNDQAKLRVLKLGDLNEGKDDEEAWDGLSDPFVHLTADERQEVLKDMNMREIERAGNKRLSRNKRQRWLQRIFRRKRTVFRKPDDL